MAGCFSGATYAQDEVTPDWETEVKAALEKGDLGAARVLAERRLGDPSSTAAAHAFLGTIDFRQQRYGEAAGHFQAAREAGAWGPDLLERWSESLQTQGRISEAIQLLEDALRRDPSFRAVRLRLADLYISTGQLQNALPQLEQVYDEGLRNVRVVLELASARFTVGKDYLAVDLLAPLTESTSSPNLLLQIGKLYFRNLLYREAAAPLERAWSLGGPSYEAGMYLSLTYHQLERYADCARILNQIQPDADKALEYHILRGSALARLERWSEAQDQLERAVASSPDRADGYLNLGLFFMERGDRQKGWEMLEKGSRRMVPGSKILYSLSTRQNCDGLIPPAVGKVKNAEKAVFYTNLAESFHKMHHWVSALEIFLLALDEDPELPEPYGGIGLICQELGSPEVGRAFLQQGIDLHPGAADLHFYLGTIYYALGRHAEAIASYQQALRLDGPSPPARHWLFLGIAQSGEGKESQEQAKSSFLRAREIDPQLALAHYELGKWYLKNGQPALAESSLERALELDPQLLGAYYQAALACLRNGKKDKGRALMEAFQKKRALRGQAARPHSEKDYAAPEGP
ncbi:MAG: tetratricopeptide repeat protein [Acidobacteriota bacterium]